jgi:molecular chaperone DnaJ
MSKRDYYEVLGVEKSVTPQELKKAYRKLAGKYHPDRNPGDAESEEMFKEAAEAYSVLSDDEKKQIYDQYGHDAPQFGGGSPYSGFGNMDDIFSNLGDLFGDLFGMGGGGGFRRVRRKGEDIYTHINLSFIESMFGTSKSVNVTKKIQCETCEGSGAKPGSGRKTCAKCGGQGQVVHRQGFFAFASTCNSCNGEGNVIEKKCNSCKGSGFEQKKEKIKVKIPAGVSDDQSIRLGGKGQAGPPGSIPGDLYISLNVKPDPNFKRQGYDLHLVTDIYYPQAVLGALFEINIPSHDDEDEILEVKVPSGTQPNDVLTFSEKGVPYLDGDGKGRGALHIHLNLVVTKNITSEEKTLIQQLADLQGHSVSNTKGFFKNLFKGE